MVCAFRDWIILIPNLKLDGVLCHWQLNRHAELLIPFDCFLAIFKSDDFGSQLLVSHLDLDVPVHVGTRQGEVACGLHHRKLLSHKYPNCGLKILKLDVCRHQDVVSFPKFLL
jgi:hypothetical protein